MTGTLLVYTAAEDIAGEKCWTYALHWNSESAANGTCLSVRCWTLLLLPGVHVICRRRRQDDALVENEGF